jgi:hypothetical protein
MTEPCQKRLCRSLGPVLNEPYESDGDSSACLSDDAADSDESTADEMAKDDITMDTSPRSSHGQPEDYELVSEAENDEDEDEDENAIAWWYAPGPDGPLRFLMRLEMDFLQKLQGYCLTSVQPLPNGSGWILDDDTLFELAKDTES